MKPTKAALATLYGTDSQTLVAQAERYASLLSRFAALFPGQGLPRLFSAPGRTEIGGNHTDHQSGRVLAASVNLDTIAAAEKKEGGIIRANSEGFAPCVVDLSALAPREEERGTTASIIRGCAARMREMGFAIGGFDVCIASNVLKGSGLSSSAAIEVLICAILDGLYNDGQMSPILRARISQYAENRYFGKPSGLMDQMASSVGGIVAIDFGGIEPEAGALRFDFAARGYTLAVVDTGGSHDELTPDYAAIRAEMEAVAGIFGKPRLREVEQSLFEKAIPELRGKVSDRALLRAFHFYDENNRVPDMVYALQDNDLASFFRLVIASGDSSWELLQNVWATPAEQPVALAMELSRRFLKKDGAWRVHGGGFAGTILAFVPMQRYDDYAAYMDAVFGKGKCCPLSIRQVGAYELETEQ